MPSRRTLCNTCRRWAYPALAISIQRAEPAHPSRQRSPPSSPQGEQGSALRGGMARHVGQQRTSCRPLLRTGTLRSASERDSTHPRSRTQHRRQGRAASRASRPASADGRHRLRPRSGLQGEGSKRTGCRGSAPTLTLSNVAEGKARDTTRARSASIPFHCRPARGDGTAEAAPRNPRATRRAPTKRQGRMPRRLCAGRWHTQRRERGTLTSTGTVLRPFCITRVLRRAARTGRLARPYTADGSRQRARQTASAKRRVM